jgi:hypothetical protein
MGVEDPVERLLAVGFDDATVAAIRGGNAERLLGPLPGPAATTPPDDDQESSTS